MRSRPAQAAKQDLIIHHHHLWSNPELPLDHAGVALRWTNMKSLTYLNWVAPVLVCLPSLGRRCPQVISKGMPECLLP